MVGQGNGLGLLQMGKARHKSICILFHDCQQLFQQFFYQRFNGVNFIPGIELHIQSHLVVAAAPCMEALSRFANPFSQGSLHKGVDILISGIG